ncbi:MAG: hypothetical protein EOO15_10355 [Chitinophagaceae bacterium]|nr:MAG: hypothetical protein EOO15_10355 [Chitinophagaceae bacterium]
MIHEHFKKMNMVKRIAGSEELEESELLQEALAALEDQTGLRTEIQKGEQVLLDGNRVWNTDASIFIGSSESDLHFVVEIKKELRQMQLEALQYKFRHLARPEQALVVSRYIPRPIKDHLRQQGISYLEVSGNCYLRQDSFYVFINDRPPTPTRVTESGKIWKPAGLKFLFPLLHDRSLLGQPYRTLAKAAGIALGSVGPFIEELRKEDYIGAVAGGRLFLNNFETMRQKWVEHYATVLRPRLRQGAFRFVDPQAFSKWEEIPAGDFRWGGEAAGALLTDFLKPERLSLYTNVPKTRLMKELRLMPDSNGSVELLSTFWNYELLRNEGPTVPPLLAYAELATSLDSRNRETADRIKEQYLK